MQLKNRTKLDKFPQLSCICPAKSEHLDEFNDCRKDEKYRVPAIRGMQGRDLRNDYNLMMYQNKNDLLLADQELFSATDVYAGLEMVALHYPAAQVVNHT